MKSCENHSLEFFFFLEKRRKSLGSPTSCKMHFTNVFYTGVAPGKERKETFFPSEKRDFYLAFFADLTYSLLEVNYPKKAKSLEASIVYDDDELTTCTGLVCEMQHGIHNAAGLHPEGISIMQANHPPHQRFLYSWTSWTPAVIHLIRKERILLINSVLPVCLQ